MENSVDLVAVLRSRLNTIVSGPGKTELKVSSVGYDSKTNRTIITLGAMTEYHARQAASKLRPHGSIENVPEDQLQEIINKHSLSYSFPADMDFYAPSKGEIVKAIFQNKVIESGDTALFCTSVQELGATKNKSFDLDSMFADEPAVEETTDAEKIAEEL